VELVKQHEDDLAEAYLERNSETTSQSPSKKWNIGDMVSTKDGEEVQIVGLENGLFYVMGDDQEVRAIKGNEIGELLATAEDLGYIPDPIPEEEAVAASKARSEEAKAKYKALYSQIEALGKPAQPEGNFREEMHKLLEMPNYEHSQVAWKPTEITIEGQELEPSENLINMVNASSEWFAKHINKQVLYRPFTLAEIDPAYTHRAYYRSDRMNLNKESTPETFAHELGHHLEYSHKRIASHAMRFLHQRIGNEEPTPLGGSGIGMNETEMGCLDNFEKLFGSASGHYAGKLYKHKSTEIVSMGLELMYKDPYHFAVTDPEYFTFMLEVMKGEHNGDIRPKNDSELVSEPPSQAPIKAKPVIYEGGSDREEIERELERIVGKRLDPESLRDMVGADPTAAVRVMRDKSVYGGLEIRMQGNNYAAKRYFMSRKEGPTIINSSFSVYDSARKEGLGTQIFATQVYNAAKAGFVKIETLAAGNYQEANDPDGPTNGYYTWPRLGYDGELPNRIRRKHPNEITRVSDLMKTKEGRLWWLHNGDSIDVEFDLREGSLSRRTLDAYLKEKGITIDTKAMDNESNERQPNKRKEYEQPPYMTPEDDAILDRIWDAIAKEGDKHA